MTQDQKTAQLERVRRWREEKYRIPELRNLFLELTLRCNERCLHCGSSCGDVHSEEMPKEDYRRILREVKEDFSKKLPMLCITGGEPLLRRDFFDILGDAHSLGFYWGMTTNGTLITPEVARELKRAGMGTVSVSLDGLPAHHDALRRTPGGFDKAMAGIGNLLAVGFDHVQVTTVVHRESLHDLDALFEILKDVDIDSWRIINMEPIGRALAHPDLMLTPDDYRYLIGYIRDKRREGYPVAYGCSHYVGQELEGQLRGWYFLCTAGIYTASIMANGDVGACLDIERRPETVMGNVYQTRFSEIWNNGFGFYRQDFAAKNPGCAACPERGYCAGDSRHTWDFDKNAPLVCMKDVLWTDT
ncbi:MAG: radical SAM protein [Clostridia bacterium]|nr:radical SAM protein [Clostridia bacterium]